MFDPAQVTLGQVSSTLRDLTIVGFLVGGAWKARGVFESGMNFLKRLTTHMDVMETGMHTLLNNHLTHIEADLKNLSYRHRSADYEMVAYEPINEPKSEI